MIVLYGCTGEDQRTDERAQVEITPKDQRTDARAQVEITQKDQRTDGRAQVEITQKETEENHQVCKTLCFLKAILTSRYEIVIQNYTESMTSFRNLKISDERLGRKSDSEELPDFKNRPGKSETFRYRRNSLKMEISVRLNRCYCSSISFMI